MSLISPEQASLAIGAIQLVFGVLIWLAAVKPGTRMPRRSSGPTAFLLWVLAGIFLAAGPQWIPAACSAFAASGWTYIAVRRPELAGPTIPSSAGVEAS